MVRVRRLIFPFILLFLLTGFGSSAVLADKHKAGDDSNGDGKTFTMQVTGNASGTARLTNPGACSPNTGGGKICEFDVSGTYQASFGAGTYSGHVTLNYATYTMQNPCATATGTITFTNANGGTITTTLAPGSKVCETTPPSTVHNATFILNVTGGTGVFEGATGTINANGTTNDTPGQPGMHTDTFVLTGTLTTRHAVDNGKRCGNDGKNNGNGNDGKDNGFGDCKAKHGDNDDQGDND